MRDTSRHSRVGEMIAVIFLIIALSLPGWYVSSIMDDRAGNEVRWVSVAVAALLVFILVGIGLALFFSRQGMGRGNREAAQVAIVAAILFALLLWASAALTDAQHPEINTTVAADVQGSVPDALPWGVVVIGGPLLLLVALAWAASRGRQNARQERRSEAGARELRRTLDDEET